MIEENARLIHGAMVARGFERDRSKTSGLWFKGQVSVQGRPVRVAVQFSDATLSKLPKLVLLDDPKTFPTVAHMEAGDRICYARDIDVQLDPLKPEQSVQWALDFMVQALADMLHKDLTRDIAAEFPQHWLSDHEVLVLDVWPKSGTGQLFQLPKTNIYALAAAPEALERLGLDNGEIAKLKQTAPKLPVLRVKRQLDFKPGVRRPTNLAELLAWAATQEFGLDQRITDALDGQTVNALALMIAGDNGVVGFIGSARPAISKAQKTTGFTKYIIQHQAGAIPIQRLGGQRADQNFVIERNLAGKPSLVGKRIGLIGFGTIGSHLSKLLGQAGAGFDGGTLSIFDEQDLSPGNVGRHLLGLADVSLNKAVAGRDFLTKLYPGIRVEGIAGDALASADALTRYDLIIDATGDFPVSINLASLVHLARSNQQSSTEILHIWLEGNGVAARALLNNGQGACRNCLKTLDGKERYALLRPEHPAAITPANCGEGAFFAYGPGASVIAAGLAVQMALDWVAGATGPNMRTIRIDETATFGSKNQNPPRLEGCRVCG